MNVGLQVHNTIDEPEYLKPLQNYMSLITGHRSENLGRPWHASGPVGPNH